jgi:hypothetical protein
LYSGLNGGWLIQKDEMGGASLIHGEMGNEQKFVLGSVMVRGCVGGLGMDGTVLKWMLVK